MLRLVTIPISHYCEKARWSLERAGIAYREERHVQGVHRIYSRRAGGSGTVPVLVTPERALGESEQILEWVDAQLPEQQRLFPADAAQAQRARELSRRFDERLGPCARRLIYVRMFEQQDVMLRFNNQGVPRREALALRVMLPLAQRFLEHELDISSGIEAADEAAVWEQLDAVAELLADGRPYLLGERFSAADLTFAALSAAVVLPPLYGVPLPPPELLDTPTRALVERARAHPAGAFALRLFEQRRAAPRAAV